MSISFMEIQTWMWPDHVAGKRETRRLREEHNKLAIAYHDLRIAMSMILDAQTVEETKRIAMAAFYKKETT